MEQTTDGPDDNTVAMRQKDVYQTDGAGFLLYPTIAHELFLSPGEFNVPYGAVEMEPPAVNEGYVPKWDGEQWAVVEDHRLQALYVVQTGARYEIGSAVESDHGTVHYDGGGPIPPWLTLEAPVTDSEGPN